MVLQYVGLILFILIFGAQSWARVDISTTTPVPLCDASLLDQPMSYQEKWSYLPDGLDQEQDRDLAVRKLADKSFQRLVSSENVKNSTVVRGVGKVEKKMQAEVSLKSDNSVEHKVAVRVLAWQAAAKVQYSGWTNAEFRYDTRQNNSTVELSEKVWRDKSLVFGSYSDPTQTLNTIGIRWPLK